MPEPITARERVRFWRELEVRFRERVGERATADDRRKALVLIHARMQKPTAAEERAVRSADQIARRAFAAEAERLADSGRPQPTRAAS